MFFLTCLSVLEGSPIIPLVDWDETNVVFGLASETLMKHFFDSLVERNSY